MATTRKKKDQAADPKPRRIVTRQIQLFNDDVIVCLECGGEFKSLPAHLARKHGLTPEQYLEKYGLPPDFPMIAKNSADLIKLQHHPDRIKFPKPQDITSDKDDLRRLRLHMKKRQPHEPAVPLDLSVIHRVGFIVLEDGRIVKQLHKYLEHQAKTTFEAYRQKWGLPDCYPTTCNSWFFKNPDQVNELRNAEESRVKAEEHGTSWPPEVSENDGEDPTQEAAPKSTRTRIRDRSKWIRKAPKRKSARR